MKVPEILLSGNDNLVEDWKHEQAVERTKKLRPDLYRKYMGEE
jgi:tRNA (guanine37-N1)-methyltransferase